MDVLLPNILSHFFFKGTSLVWFLLWTDEQISRRSELCFTRRTCQIESLFPTSTSICVLCVMPQASDFPLSTFSTALHFLSLSFCLSNHTHSHTHKYCHFSPPSMFPFTLGVIYYFGLWLCCKTLMHNSNNCDSYSIEAAENNTQTHFGWESRLRLIEITSCIINYILRASH